VDDGAAITMSAASPLSAAAHPFFPGETSMGRSMQLRWLDSGDEEMVDQLHPFPTVWELHGRGLALPQLV